MYGCIFSDVSSKYVFPVNHVIICLVAEDVQNLSPFSQEYFAYLINVLLQISMNALLAIIPVMKMLTVLIFLVATTAHVELDTLGMAPHVKVRSIH